MKGLAASLLLAAIAHCAYGHGGHEHSGPSQGETIQQYAQRHVRLSLLLLVAHGDGTSCCGIWRVLTYFVYRCLQSIICQYGLLARRLLMLTMKQRFL